MGLSWLLCPEQQQQWRLELISPVKHNLSFDCSAFLKVGSVLVISSYICAQSRDSNSKLSILQICPAVSDILSLHVPSGPIMVTWTFCAPTDLLVSSYCLAVPCILSPFSSPFPGLPHAQVSCCLKLWSFTICMSKPPGHLRPLTVWTLLTDKQKHESGT